MSANDALIQEVINKQQVGKDHGKGERSVCMIICVALDGVHMEDVDEILGSRGKGRNVPL